MEKLNPSTIGGISELKVACELLSKGYELFRPLVDNASCDFIILKNGEMRRVEVKTAHHKTNGEIQRPSGLDPTRFDILACVLPEGIAYEPEI